MNGAVKLKQNKKNHDILVLIQEFEIRELKMRMHVVSIIAP